MKTSAVLATALVLIQISKAKPSLEKVQGKTFDLRTNNLIYVENRVRNYFNSNLLNAQVWYVTQEKDTLAQKKLTYKHSALRPDVEFNQFQNDYYLKVVNEANTVHITFKEGKTKFEKSISVPENAVIDGGIRNFVIGNLEKILNNNTLSFPLVVPERAAYYYFEVKMEKKIDNNTILFSMSPKNVFLSLLAPKIEFYYNIPSQELELYTGISDIKDKKGKNLQVKIEYSKETLPAKL